MKGRTSIGAAFAIVLLAAGCGLATSFDEYDTSGAPNRFTVRGSVEGLENGVQATLSLNGTPPITVGNGPFAFTTTLADGESYSIAATAKEHACAGVTGNVRGADVMLSVRCPSTDTALSALTVSSGPVRKALPPPFTAGATIATALPLFAPSTSFEGVPRSPSAKIRIGATTVAPGAPLAIAALARPVPVDLYVVAASGAEARYTVLLDVSSTYTKASNTRKETYFGYGVAIDGDTLAVGAWGESSAAVGVDGDQKDTSASSSGAVYVFKRSGAVWAQEAYLKASNNRKDVSFGYSVSLSGNTLAVGAWGEDSASKGVDGDPSPGGQVQAGAAYVFTRNAGKWSQQAYIKASNTSYAAAFGRAVVVEGDTLVVGSPWERGASTGIDGDQTTSLSNGTSGAVYVFTRSAGTWSQQAYIKASNKGGNLGEWGTVALSGNTLAVGAFAEKSKAMGIDGDQSDVSAPGAGAVYVFERAGITWSQKAYVKASNTRAGAAFGGAVALAGDTLAVGAYFDASKSTGINGDQSDTSLARAGAVYVFGRTGGTWKQQAYVKASATQTNALFGGAVALAGDRMVVGAGGDDAETGAAYVFQRSAGVWSQTARLRPSTARTRTRYGEAVALSADALVVGGSYEASRATGIGGDETDVTAPESGAVWIY